MQYHWLNKQNNNKLIIFFAGWSFDYKPFEFLNCDNYDILMLYDYNSFNIPLNIQEYDKTYLISWSMGVFAAYILRNNLPEFTQKIAINGTLLPVDNDFGIPERPFLLTLKHAKTGLGKKFYENIFQTQEEFERYMLNPVERPIDNRIDELNSLYKKIKAEKIDCQTYYDKAIVSRFDKIIPPQNQINFWQQNNTPCTILETGHFPYYNFTCWNEILCI